MCERAIHELPLIVREKEGLIIFSLFHYTGEIKKLISFLKGGKHPRVVHTLARILVEKTALYLPSSDGAIPAPAATLGAADHARVWAESVGVHLGVKVYDRILTRVPQNTDQKTKDIKQRHEIKVAPGPDFNAESVQEAVWILVDDVITTGSTLQACWNQLQKPQAYGLTLASTPRFFD